MVSLLAIGSARADDGAWMQVGDAGNFTKNKQIRMVEEEVWIKLSNTGMRVHVVFKFQNEGPATQVTMAFPDGIHDYKPRATAAPRAIRWFKSKVDGKPVPVKRQQYRSEKDNNYEEYTHVWLKTVPFKANQTRIVTVDYEANHGDIGDYIEDAYTLKTGATWKGSIGKAVVYIDWSGLRGQSDPNLSKSPKPLWGGKPLKVKMLSPRSARVEFRNFEPDFNISMDWATAFGNFYLNGRRMKDPPVGASRFTFIKGDGRDPMIEISHLEALLKPTSFTDSEAMDEEVDFRVRGKRVQAKDRKVLVNGKPLRLGRGYKKGDIADWESWVHLKDLVQALGGSYRYDSKWDRAYIKL